MEPRDGNLDWYIQAIKHELNRLRDAKFMGDLQVKFHLKDGKIGHMFFTQNKSVKKPK